MSTSGTDDEGAAADDHRLRLGDLGVVGEVDVAVARALTAAVASATKISSAERSSSGKPSFAPASAYQRFTSSRTFSGCSAARLCNSERSTSMWYSSHSSSLKLLQPLIVGWVVTAFQPSCQMPREPSIE